MENNLSILIFDFINNNLEYLILLLGLTIPTIFLFLYFIYRRIDHLETLDQRSSDAPPPIQSIREEKWKFFGILKRRVNKTKFFEPQTFNGFSSIPGRMGFVCNHCTYVTGNRKDMQKHVGRKHKFT